MSASEDGTPRFDDSGRIERQIEETRLNMTSTLIELERKLSARQITTEMFDALRDAVIGTGEGSNDMIEMVRRNPIPVALIGIGIGWMVFGTTRRTQATSAHIAAADDLAAPSRGSNGAGIAGQTAAAAAHPTGPIRRAEARLGRRARAVAGTAQRAGAALEDNPLVLGALGLALGALLGAVLPLSRRESEWLGEAQHEVIDQAEALGRDTLERARTVAEQAGRAAVEVVERELGLERATTPPTNKPH